jgi:hypothetical protein
MLPMKKRNRPKLMFAPFTLLNDICLPGMDFGIDLGRMSTLFKYSDTF